MGYYQVGACPKCGAPVYAQADGWMSILPPPSIPSCSCAYNTKFVVEVEPSEDGQSVTIRDPQKELLEVAKEFKEAVKLLKEIIDGSKDRKASV